MEINIYSTPKFDYTFTFEPPSDPEYKRFLENISCDEEKSLANPEILLGEIEAKTRELIGTQLQTVNYSRKTPDLD